MHGKIRTLGERGRKMYIIADVEWVEKKAHRINPTQLAAVRVDEKWEIVDDFSSYIRPQNSSFYDWEHMAYLSGKPDAFMNAPSCYDVFKSFNEWVGEDKICWWYRPSADVHALINRIVLNQKVTREPIVLCEYMAGFFKGKGVYKGGAYKLAEARGIEVPYPRHDSWNDVMAIIRLFKGVGFPQTALSMPPIKLAPQTHSPSEACFEYHYDTKSGLLHKKGCELLPQNAEVLPFGSLKKPMQRNYKACSCVGAELRAAKRLRVIDEIKRTYYTFIYTEKSNVFHRFDCGLLHSADRILGTEKYATVIKKGLRPCKVCKPSADDYKRPEMYEHKIEAMTCPKLVKNSLKKEERVAIKRLEESQKERDAKIKSKDMTEQERNDLMTLTQPRFAFFAGRGYRNFHLRSCTRLENISDIKGFSTFAHAKKSGYLPCKSCKPTNKQDIVVSIPIANRVRKDETIDDLNEMCEKYGYGHSYHENDFEVVTAVGKWRILTDTRPVTVEHINIASYPDCETYHKQHRIFLSMLDALKYIYRHDSAIEGKLRSADDKENFDFEWEEQNDG